LGENYTLVLQLEEYLMRQIFVMLVVFILLFSMLGCTAVTTQTPLVTFAAVGETTDPIGTATLEKNPPKSTEAPEEKNKGLMVSSTNPDFFATEILGRPTDTSIIVNIVPANAMELYYEYGTELDAYTARTPLQNASAGVILETLIDGLQPNTRFYYRLRYGNVAGQ